jgi:hypothetical protein
MLEARNPALALLSAALLAFFLFGCATPPWAGMSESEIAAWKAAGFGPDQARGWYDAKFSAEDASAWKEKGFHLESAVEWHQQKFTADEAASWKAAGMNTEKAVENRDQGLMPIPPSD